MPFSTSQDYIEELEKRKKDPEFAAATKVNATDRFLKAIVDRLLDGGNVCINMFGPPNHGKSNSMRKLARIIINFLVTMAYKVTMESDVEYTRNYAESLMKFADRAKSPNWRTPIIVLQDEKLRMTGRNRIIATRNLMNNLDSFRVLIYCYLVCYCAYWKEIVKKRESFANMGFLILEGVDHDWEDLKQNRFIWWTREGPVGYVYIDFEEESNIKYDAWKIPEQRATTSNLGAVGAHMTDFDALAEQIILRFQRTPELAKKEKPKLRDFEGLVRLMHESGEIIASDSDERTAAWWAHCKYGGANDSSRTSCGSETQLEPSRILADGSDIKFQPEKLPEKDYAALRQIAEEEYMQALPEKARMAEIIQALITYDYPPDANVKRWSHRRSREALGVDEPHNTIEKRYNRYIDFISNEVKERICMRFIDYLIRKTPDFPTQISFASGRDQRDMSLILDGRLVASANMKHYSGHGHDNFTMTPEFRDPVHYLILVETIPFTLQVHRGKEGEEVVTRRHADSVWDLGWTGFVEDLRREAEKAKQS